MTVGPAPPLALQKRKRTPEQDASTDPSNPIPPAKIRAVNSPSAPTHPTVLKRVLGPAPPPADLTERPEHTPSDHEDSSSEDDDFGPSLPPIPGSAAQQRAEVAEDRETQLRQAAKAHAVSPGKPQRPDWMLAPPSDTDWTGRIDPTKLKNRKFTSGKGATATGGSSGGVSAIWTETPEEKRQRLEDEILGRKDGAVNAKGGQDARGKGHKEDEQASLATARRIEAYNERNRAKTLMNVRKELDSQGKEVDDDPSKRAFDREKDMALGGLSGMQKRDMMKKAGDFGSRFQKGNYL